jgi:hypothetical protein
LLGKLALASRLPRQEKVLPRPPSHPHPRAKIPRNPPQDPRNPLHEEVVIERKLLLNHVENSKKYRPLSKSPPRAKQRMTSQR